MISHLFDLSDAVMMSKSEGYHVTVHGSTHSSFTDRSLFSPLKRYSGEGDIPANREYAIIREYVLAFFRQDFKWERFAAARCSESPAPRNEHGNPAPALSWRELSSAYYDNHMALKLDTKVTLPAVVWLVSLVNTFG